MIFGFLTLVTPAYALFEGPDALRPVLRCNQPNLADAGYQVTILAGGVAYHREAKIDEISFTGSRTIANYVVDQANDTSSQLQYLDTNSGGAQFRLVVDQDINLEQGGTNATLSATTSRGRIVENLRCQLVYQIQQIQDEVL